MTSAHFLKRLLCPQGRVPTAFWFRKSGRAVPPPIHVRIVEFQCGRELSLNLFPSWGDRRSHPGAEPGTGDQPTTEQGPPFVFGRCGVSRGSRFVQGVRSGGETWRVTMANADTTVDNGVNVEALIGAREALTKAPAAAQFKWRAACECKNGT